MRGSCVAKQVMGAARQRSNFGNTSFPYNSRLKG